MEKNKHQQIIDAEQECYRELDILNSTYKINTTVSFKFDEESNKFAVSYIGGKIYNGNQVIFENEDIFIVKNFLYALRLYLHQND